jgi:hypothetical protein
MDKKEQELALSKLKEMDKKYVELYNSLEKIKGLTKYQEQDIWTYMQEIDINMGKLALYLEDLMKG